MKTLNKHGLADALGLSRQTVLKHLQKPDAPQPDDSGRYRLQEVRAFILRTQKSDNRREPTGDLLVARIRKLDLECKELRQRLHLSEASIPVSKLEPLLWELLNEINKVQMSVLHEHGESFLNITDFDSVRTVGRKFIEKAQLELSKYFQTHGIKVGATEISWPLPHPSFRSE